MRYLHYDNGLREVHVRSGDDYFRGCLNEEGRVIVAPEKDGPYIGMTNGLALINEGARDANGIFIPEAAKCSVLNAEGERVKSFDRCITWYDGRRGFAAISAKDGAGAQPYNLLYALTDENGTPVTAFEFEGIQHFRDSSRDLFWAKKDGLWGCIRADGSVKLPFAYRQIGFPVSNTGVPSSGVWLTEEYGKQGFASLDGDIVIPAVYNFVGAFFDDPLIPVMNDEKWAYFNDAGENVTGFVYDYSVYSFSEGLAQVYTGDESGTFGFIGTDFKTVLPPVYTGMRQGSGLRRGQLYLYKGEMEEVVENPLQYTRKIKFYVNGDWIYTASGQEAFIDPEAGRTLAPLRRIAEALGCEVQWFSEERGIALANATRAVRLTVGAADASVNLFDDGVPAKTVSLDVPPRIVGGRVYVPLRFIAESCGAQVDWDAENTTIRITGASAAQSAPTAGTGSATTQ
jgi:hypothetical protein